MTAKIIPFPPKSFRLTVQGYYEQPAKIIDIRDRVPKGYDPESWAYELYVKASNLDENDDRLDEEAKALYVRAIKLNPNLDVAHTNLGNIHYQHGDNETAIACYRAAIDIDPRQPEANFNIGYILLDDGNEPSLAIEWFRKAVAYDPCFADAHFNLATCLTRTGRRLQARKHWKAFLDLEPTGEQANKAREALRPGRRGKK